MFLRAKETRRESGREKERGSRGDCKGVEITVGYLQVCGELKGK